VIWRELRLRWEVDTVGPAYKDMLQISDLTRTIEALIGKADLGKYQEVCSVRVTLSLIPLA
jgi:hypothetical protein